MQIGKFEKIKPRKIAFCLRGEIDKLILHKKPPHEIRGRRTIASLWFGRSQTANNAGLLCLFCSLSHCPRLTNIIASLTLSICPSPLDSIFPGEGALFLKEVVRTLGRLKA
jgi:hypothetical protein